jgi:site-specific recombinase XerD
MFANYFGSKGRIHTLRNSTGGAMLEGFACDLWQAGYAEITGRRHIRAAEHLAYWADQNAIRVDEFQEQVLSRFDQHLVHCQCPGYGHYDRMNLVSGARLFMGYLRGAGVIDAFDVDQAVQDPILLTSFCEWMRLRRGTKDSTLCTYSISIRELLKHVGDEQGRLDAKCLRQFVLDTSRKQGLAATKNCTTALRMFLRFLVAEGKCEFNLADAVPVVAQWKLSSLPRYLKSEDVERVIASCDLGSPVGRRDRAILLLLARLGFRAGDIVQIQLEDIDWKGAWLSVTGKSRRQTKFPLTQEVGQAIINYLQDGRPQADTTALFVGSRAPFRAFANHCAISVIVAKAMQRADVHCPSGGAAHVLRHSVATSMLREGISLQDIAVILGHRSIATTQIYAKVDRSTLQQITQPWPEVQP